MAQCPTCNRNLPFDGKCLFCGAPELGGHTKERKRTSAVGLWISWILKLAVAGALCYAAYWLIFTPEGGKTVQKIRTAIGMDPAERELTPALKVLATKPKIDEWIKDLRVKIEEETTSNANIKIIAMRRQDGPDLFTATFQVNLQTKAIIPQDATAKQLMK